MLVIQIQRVNHVICRLGSLKYFGILIVWVNSEMLKVKGNLVTFKEALIN